MKTDVLQGEVIDNMPVTQATAMTNPYLAMAQQALSMGQVEHVEKLLDLQFKWEANEQRKAFVAAMSAFKAEPISIVKAKRVSFKTNSGWTEYDHAELVDVTNAVVPAMARHGLSHRWTVKQEAGAITVECVVTHRDGHSESVSMTAPPDTSGGKNTIQSIASTKTYLERYTLLAATGVATGGELDNDGRGDPEAPSRPAEEESIDARLAQKIEDFNEAFGRLSESVTYIQERIAADDIKAAAGEWFQFSEKEQTSLFLAKSKGGCFTATERDVMKLQFGQYNPKRKAQESQQ